MRKTIISFLVFFIMGVAVHAQSDTMSYSATDSTYLIDDDEEEDNETESNFAKDVLSDTSINFNEYALNKDSIAFWKNKKEYGWISNLDSFLLAKKKEASAQSKVVVSENRGGSFLGSLFNSGVLQFIIWLVAAALVIFIIYKLFLSQGIFSKQSAKSKLQVQEVEEEVLLNNDYDSLINRGYGSGDLRLAMHFLFLKTLKKLSDRELITYAVDKTNTTYMTELPAAKRNDFAALALYYEYVWYGKISIERTTFDSIKSKFDEFLNRL
ncbi:MAG: hypothetical protein ACKVOM_08575 [Ferruginibacter sp.]